MNQKQILEVLKYIASSPPEKSGGFHENTINVAKDAIKLIADLKSDNARLKEIILRTILICRMRQFEGKSAENQMIEILNEAWKGEWN